MLSRSQQILLKRAQREAGLADDDYRSALELIAGCRTSKDLSLTDRHLDKLLAYFEAIHWRGVDAGTLHPSGSSTAVFRQRGYWVAKNTRQETSRDRFTGLNLQAEIAALGTKLAALGFGERYCASIRAKVIGNRDDEHALHLFRTALARTLDSKKEAALTPC